MVINIMYVDTYSRGEFQWWIAHSKKNHFYKRGVLCSFLFEIYRTSTSNFTTEE